MNGLVMGYAVHSFWWRQRPLIRVWMQRLVTPALAVLVVGMWVVVGWVIAYLASGPAL